MTYYKELIKFIDQAKTVDLGTARNNYLQYYDDLNVKISFGQGAVANIPWISFLADEQTTSNGIYPVYLYFKAEGLLILAYGISVTKTPNDRWEIKNSMTIKEYFNNNNLGIPFNYGNSFIYKVYNITQLPSQEVIDKDLQWILNYYKSIMENRNPNLIFQNEDTFDYHYFLKSTENSGLIFSPQLIHRFIASLITKPFVILSGLSGSGKTKLAQAFAQWICQDESQYCIVPVGADWTNREPLLGYLNALKPEEYIKPENGALVTIIEAINNPELPYFLILDEMNLSHVERYFADFLSVMESKGDISLYSEGTVNNDVRAKLQLPSNLFIIGTVNIDETTYMFSPKVLDRANAIEFRVTKSEIENFFTNQKEVDMNKLKTKGASMAQSFLSLAENKSFEVQDAMGTNKILVSFFEQLKKAGAEFGYRSASEIIRLMNQLSVIDTNISIDAKLDIAIMQKLLPKLHGSRRKLCPILITIGSFCLKNDKIVNIEKEVFSKEDFNFESDDVKYPISLEKITRMYRGAIENGFASYAEA